MAMNLLSVLNKYERNYRNACVTWYELNLTEFLEPMYNPSYVLAGSPEVDWYRSEKTAPDMYVMKDGSLVWCLNSGMWEAMLPNTKKAI